MTATNGRSRDSDASSVDGGLPQPALQLETLTAGYGATVILRDIDMTIEPSTVVALLGRNGAGKSTLLRTVGGMLEPLTGTIRLQAADVTRLGAHARARRGLCCIAQGRSVFRSLSVRDNLRMWTIDGDEPDASARAIDAFPILGRRLGQTAGSLSGGEQQMLAVARAYVQQAQVVFIDEVSLGLAPRMIDQFNEFLADLAATGVALVIVEQFVNRALALADSVYVLGRGRVLYHDAADAISAAELGEIYLER